MTISKALEILDIADIFSETEESVKKKYRLLIKKYHPDTIGEDADISRDITQAYDIIKKELPSLLRYKQLNTDKKVVTIGLPLEQLIQIYSGQSFINKKSGIVINKTTIHNYNTIIFVEGTLTHNSITQDMKLAVPLQYNKQYDMWAHIDVVNLSDTEDITIDILDKHLQISISSISARLHFKFNRDIVVNITIDKRIPKDTNSND